MPLIQDRDMEHVTTSEQDAPVRLTPEQAEQLVLRTVSQYAEALLRTARRHSLCVDDAHDAYQRSLEILMRRAQTLDPDHAGGWMHAVVRNEALAVRRSRIDLVHPEDVDLDDQEAIHVESPEDRALSVDRVTRAAEALQRVKPQELQAMWLKALGKSYEEICAETGWSYTKVNRCLAEGRKSFLERFAGIEAGEECERWQPVLSAIVDGEATARQLADVRPHLRNCSACRSTLRELHEAQRPLLSVLPAGLIGLSVKATSLVDRLLPGAPVGETVSAGGAGVFGVGAIKLAGVVAAGVAATGGGLAVTEHAVTVHHHKAKSSAVVRHAPKPSLAGRIATARTRATVTVPAAPAHRSSPSPHRSATRSHQTPARTAAAARRAEFLPSGPQTSSSRAAAIASEPAPSSPTSTPSPAHVDSSSGEFAPQP